MGNQGQLGGIKGTQGNWGELGALRTWNNLEPSCCRNVCSYLTLRWRAVKMFAYVWLSVTDIATQLGPRGNWGGIRANHRLLQPSTYPVNQGQLRWSRSHQRQPRGNQGQQEARYKTEFILHSLHWENYFSISFHIEWNIIVVTVFVLILNQMEFHLV